MLPSFRNHSTDLLVERQIGFMKALKAFKKSFDAPQANQLTGFYIRATLTFNGLNEKVPLSFWKK